MGIADNLHVTEKKIEPQMNMKTLLPGTPHVRYINNEG